MQDPIPPTGLIAWLQAFLGGGATSLFVAGLSRLVWHGQEAQAGRRPWIGPHLLIELPIAVVMAVVAEAAGEWAGLSQPVTTGVIAVVSYLGPRGMRDLIDRWLSRPNKKE